VADRGRAELLRLPGVRAVESTRFVPVTLVNGHRRERSQIRGYPAPRPSCTAWSTCRAGNHPADWRRRGADRPAGRKLGLRVGDTVQAEVLEGRPRTLQCCVCHRAEMMGLNAYMGASALNRALGEGDLASGFVLSLDPGPRPAAAATTRDAARWPAAFSKASMLRNMQEISARNIRIMSTVLTLFGRDRGGRGLQQRPHRAGRAHLGAGQPARAGLHARRGVGAAAGRDGAVHRLALPLGMLLGWGLVHLLAGAMASDQFQFPVVIQPRTYAWAALCVVAAGAGQRAGGAPAHRPLDMVAALKTRGTW
jgi:putative ABC transport system permease protein